MTKYLIIFIKVVSILICVAMFGLYVAQQHVMHFLPNQFKEKLMENSHKMTTKAQVTAVNNSSMDNTSICEVDFRSPLSDKDDDFTRRIKMRILKAEEMCKTNSTIKEQGLLVMKNKIVVDEKHKVVYVPIPKTGTSNWKRIFTHATLLKYQHLPRSKIKNIPAPHSEGIVYLNKFNVTETRRILREYYKFTFVREPFQRLLSAFRDKFLYGRFKAFRKIYGKKVASYEETFAAKVNPNTTKTVDGRYYTFRSFFRYLARTNPSKYNDHWSCYINRALPCLFKYDFIGKIETIKEDLSHITHCKLNEGSYDEIFTNMEPSSNAVYNEFYATVDDADVIKVYEYFQREYQYFQYPMPDVVKQAKIKIN